MDYPEMDFCLGESHNIETLQDKKYLQGFRDCLLGFTTGDITDPSRVTYRSVQMVFNERWGTFHKLLIAYFGQTQNFKRRPNGSGS
jgi:hypothetical protein